MKFGNDWFYPEIDRKVLKQLSKRSNWQASKHVALFFALLFLFGYLSFLFWSTWWFLLFYFLYSVVYSSANPIWHECGHRTAFRSRILNEIFYQIGSFMTDFEPIRWRWSHTLHHSYTSFSFDPHDYEVDHFHAKPSLLSFLSGFIPFIQIRNIHKSLQKETLLHALGFTTPVMKDCIPESEIWKCRLIARIHVSIWVLTILISIFTQSLLPILFILTPKYFGSTLPHLFGLTQHMCLPSDIKDHRQTTRTVILNPVFSFLYWHMEYHIEHHMFPMIPAYNLSKLHKVIKNQLPPPKNGLIDAYKEIIPTIIKQHKDPEHILKVSLPV